MTYVEDRELVVRLELRCAFPDDYDGDEDGYAWAEEIPAIAGDVARAVAQALARRAGWRVRAANRGRPADEEITLIVERVLASAASAPK